jgi:hypothetical protein
VGICGNFKSLSRSPPDTGQANAECFGNTGRCDPTQLTACHKDAPFFWDQKTAQPPAKKTAGLIEKETEVSYKRSRWPEKRPV